MKKKFAARSLSLVLAVVLMLACAVTAFAEFGECDPKYEKVNGIQYKFYSLIHNEVKGQINYQTNIYPTDSTVTIPMGAMGARAKLYNSNGTLADYSDWDYSDWTSGDQMLLQSESYATSPGLYYYSRGDVQIHNGQRYVTYSTYSTPNFTPKRSMLPRNISVQRNAKGEIYGSELFLEELGVKPDLISALGTDGTEGYVRAEDLDANKANTIAEALAIAAARDTRTDRYIPLYMSDGETVIGTFKVSAGSNHDIRGDIPAEK